MSDPLRIVSSHFLAKGFLQAEDIIDGDTIAKCLVDPGDWSKYAYISFKTSDGVATELCRKDDLLNNAHGSVLAACMPNGKICVEKFWDRNRMGTND